MSGRLHRFGVRLDPVCARFPMISIALTKHSRSFSHFTTFGRSMDPALRPRAGTLELYRFQLGMPDAPKSSVSSVFFHTFCNDHSLDVKSPKEVPKQPKGGPKSSQVSPKVSQSAPQVVLRALI